MGKSTVLREGNALYVHVREEASEAILGEALRHAGEICAQAGRAFLVLCTDIAWPLLIESWSLETTSRPQGDIEAILVLGTQVSMRELTPLFKLSFAVTHFVSTEEAARKLLAEISAQPAPPRRSDSKGGRINRLSNPKATPK